MLKSFSIEEFNKTYKGTKKFCQESEYFDVFLKFYNGELNKYLDNIIFCNDVLQIPPIYTFVKIYKENFKKCLNAYEKKSLGACFGYMFKYILGYKKSISKWVGDEITNIKNASYFIEL